MLKATHVLELGDAIADFDATTGDKIILSAITGGIGSFNGGAAFTTGE
ncbi:hypothetical protein [Anabaena azotica]